MYIDNKATIVVPAGSENIHLQVANKHKHLGGIVTHRCDLAPEFRQRAASVLKELNPQLEQEAQRQVAP